MQKQHIHHESIKNADKKALIAIFDDKELLQEKKSSNVQEDQEVFIDVYKLLIQKFKRDFVA
jgi:hypothetical protein